MWPPEPPTAADDQPPLPSCTIDPGHSRNHQRNTQSAKRSTATAHPPFVSLSLHPPSTTAGGAGPQAEGLLVTSQVEVFVFHQAKKGGLSFTAVRHKLTRSREHKPPTHITTEGHQGKNRRVSKSRPTTTQQEQHQQAPIQAQVLTQQDAHRLGGPSPCDPHRHALARRPPRKSRPFGS